MGGACGSAAQVLLNPDTAQQQDIGKIDILQMQPGDRLRMITPSGGGFGDPFQRDPEAVLAETADRLLSADQARAQYGVAITGGTIDPAASSNAAQRQAAGSARFQPRPDPDRA